MKALIESTQKRFRKVEETAEAARNLVGDGSKIGVDITPKGATIKWVASPETETVQITGAAVGGVYPGVVVRWNGSAWVSTGQTCDVVVP